MGLVIEKERNRDSDENTNADKLEDRDKKRKKNKSQPKVHVEDIGDRCESFNVKEEELNLDIDKNKQRKAHSSRGNRKTLTKKEAPISASSEELEELEGEFTADAAKHGLDAGERKSKEKRAGKPNLLEKERKGDHTRSKCDICCCVRVVKDFDGVQDEKEKDMEGGDQEKQIHEEKVVEGEENSHRYEEEISIPRDERSDVSNTRTPDSPLNVRKVHERKIRFQSSRPTSLETILEDVVASPFFFQDSIIKSLDGREDHRGVREGSNLFQVVQEEEKGDELESEEEGGEDSWRKRNINRMRGSGELFSEDDFNILPLWNSRIFQGVIENLNYLLDNNESDAVPSTTSSSSSSREFLEYPFKRSGSLSSSTSSKYGGGVESETIAEIIDTEVGCLTAGKFSTSNNPPDPRRQSEQSQEPVSGMNRFGHSALVHERREETDTSIGFRAAKQTEKSEDENIYKDGMGVARNSRSLEILKPEDNFLNTNESKKVRVIEMAPLCLPRESALSKPTESKSEPVRKVSFTIHIQYEKVISELTPKDTENKHGEASYSNNPEGQLELARASGERSEECNYVEIQESLGKVYQLKLLQAIQSLDSLNDQIVEFIFSGAEFEEEHGGSPKQREALKSSMSLMRRLLVDAQSKFRKMVEDNKQLASRIDGELQTAHQEVNLLRQELADTNRRITQIQEHNNHHNMEDIHHRPDDGGMMSEGPTQRPDTPTTNTTINGPSKYHNESSTNQLAEEMSQLRLENEKLTAKNRSLQREVEELRRVKESMVEEDLQLKPHMNQMTMELTHAKEALSALKADRKRLKAEKFDLLNQMKQLYATLEDKEKELRDFIRNYEQRMKESDESLRHLAAERDETEREKWNILRHARDESEKVVKLSAQLGLKEAAIKKLQDDLDMVRKQLTSVGYYSDAESVRTNGLPTPTASTPTCSPQPVSTTPTPTPNGRGSSADSGVRLSSDRDSTASHDGTPTITVEHGSFDCDTLSVCSSATAASSLYYHACGVGTPKESPSLSPLYATPSSMKGEDRGGDSTPTGGPGTTGPSLNSSAMSGLASSNASTGGLSRSAEQLCERLAEASEASKGRGGGSSTLSRKGNKSGGTWGSISRVFARQKKRAALDASLYDGNGSDKRASWSPSSSLCVSPLTEESYSEKLRLLEEAQHIPLERWKAPTVLAWLEVTLGMPQYGAMCAENVRSGKVLLELSDSELEAGLGISHPMHRKKLRLAIEELREPRLSRFPRISALGHTWVSSEWLPDLGLPQYCDAFANNLVDGRLLEALTKKELEKHLGVHRKFHQASIIHGVHLLRIVRFDRQILAERRRQSENVDCDPLVWTNIRWVKWARTIDLAEYADNLKDSGVHGALVVLESSFTCDTMATALGIPQSKNIIRRHLATELESLVNPARQQLDEQARFAKLERRRQEKLAAGGSLGRSFSRSYGTGLEKSEKDKRRASLRFGTWRSSQVLS